MNTSTKIFIGLIVLLIVYIIAAAVTGSLTLGIGKKKKEEEVEEEEEVEPKTLGAVDFKSFTADITSLNTVEGYTYERYFGEDVDEGSDLYEKNQRLNIDISWTNPVVDTTNIRYWLIKRIVSDPDESSNNEPKNYYYVLYNDDVTGDDVNDLLSIRPDSDATVTIENLHANVFRNERLVELTLEPNDEINPFGYNTFELYYKFKNSLIDSGYIGGINIAKDTNGNDCVLKLDDPIEPAIIPKDPNETATYNLGYQSLGTSGGSFSAEAKTILDIVNNEYIYLSGKQTGSKVDNFAGGLGSQMFLHKDNFVYRCTDGRRNSKKFSPDDKPTPIDPDNMMKITFENKPGDDSDVPEIYIQDYDTKKYLKLSNVKTDGSTLSDAPPGVSLGTEFVDEMSNAHTFVIVRRFGETGEGAFEFFWADEFDQFNQTLSPRLFIPQSSLVNEKTKGEIRCGVADTTTEPIHSFSYLTPLTKLDGLDLTITGLDRDVRSTTVKKIGAKSRRRRNGNNIADYIIVNESVTINNGTFPNTLTDGRDDEQIFRFTKVAETECDYTIEIKTKQDKDDTRTHNGTTKVMVTAKDDITDTTFMYGMLGSENDASANKVNSPPPEQIFTIFRQPISSATQLSEAKTGTDFADFSNYAIKEYVFMFNKTPDHELDFFIGFKPEEADDDGSPFRSQFDNKFYGIGMILMSPTASQS